MSVVETTRALVRIPSVNPGYDPASSGERDMAEALLAWAREHSFEAFSQEVFPGRSNVILRLRNGADRPSLLWNGHTDTVAVDGMTIPPFAAELCDGRVWGRGSTDMKGPLACMLEALLLLRGQPEAWSGTITLACVVDEELGFSGIRHFLQTESGFDFAVVAEPTEGQVVRGCKGCLRFYVRAHGKAAHSSTPEKGVNAIAAMAEAIRALTQYFAGSLAEHRHPDLGASTGSVGLIRGGSGVNIVPDFCEIKVDVRLVPGQSWQDTYAGIRHVVESSGDGVRWEFEDPPMADPPFCLEAAHPVVDSICAALGRERSEVVNYSCDASKIAGAGIPVAICGPGDIGQAHTADESVAVAELERGVEDYVRIAKRLLAPSPAG